MSPRKTISFFHFTRLERLGVVVLFTLTAAGFLLPELARWWKPSPTSSLASYQQELKAADPPGGSEIAAGRPAELFPFNPNTATAAELVRLGLSERLAATICRYRERGGQYRRPEDFQKMYGLAAADFNRLSPYLRLQAGEDGSRTQEAARPAGRELFAFDPNVVSEADWQRLGLPRFLAARIMKYRSKGGAFRCKADVQKIYDFPPDLFAQLEPYIVLPGSEAPRPVTYGGGQGQAFGETSTPTAKEPETVEINQATEADWQKLPGIGPARATWIVRFRDRLGGFTDISQVAETRGLPDSVFQALKTRLALHSEPYRKIDINTVTAEELKTHPYFSYRQIALILAYRSQHGPFAAVEQIGQIELCRDPEWLQRVKPYLEAR